MDASLWDALALLLVIEGLLPFANPGLFRRIYEKALQLDDRQLRRLGLFSMAVGAIALMLARAAA